MLEIPLFSDVVNMTRDMEKVLLGNLNVLKLGRKLHRNDINGQMGYLEANFFTPTKMIVNFAEVWNAVDSFIYNEGNYGYILHICPENFFNR